MTRKAEHIPDGAWPALMIKSRAAAYCDMSVNTFDANVPVEPVKIGNIVLYPKWRLDAFIDGLTNSEVNQNRPSERAGNASAPGRP